MAEPTRKRTGAAEREAARWVARTALQPRLHAAERRAFEAWLETPGAAAAFERLSGLIALPERDEPVVRAVHARASARERAGRVQRARAISLAAVVATVAIGVHLADPPALFADERSGVGEVRRIALEDGSMLWLDARSAVDIDFSDNERTLELVRGQIYVRAAHEARPLVVRVAGGEVVDIGTEFAVRRGEGGASVEVAEGAVRASSEGVDRILRAGDAAEWKPGETPRLRPSAEPDLAGAWRNGVIVVKDRALAEVIADVNRHRLRPYVLTDAAVAGRRVSGVVQTRASETGFESLARSQGLIAVDLGFVVWLRPTSDKK